MPDRIDLVALDTILEKAAAACNDLEGVLEADRTQRPHAERVRRGELADELWRIRNGIARARAAIRHLGGPIAATSRDVAPETTEADLG